MTTRELGRIARVFPRRTAATPTDDLAFAPIGSNERAACPGINPPEVDAVHISVAFSCDLPRAEWLADQWAKIAPVTMGGPAFGKPEGEFTPGMYVKSGYVVTSRGCPNRCGFCDVWRRHPTATPMQVIHDGWDDDDDEYTDEVEYDDDVTECTAPPSGPTRKGAYAGCRWCDGKGCLCCEEERRSDEAARMEAKP